MIDSVVPAQPGFVLLDFIDGFVLRTPIIAWKIEGGIGTRPITTVGIVLNTDAAVYGVLAPDGSVTCLCDDHRAAFADVQAWLDHGRERRAEAAELWIALVSLGPDRR